MIVLCAEFSRTIHSDFLLKTSIFILVLQKLLSVYFSYDFTTTNLNDANLEKMKQDQIPDVVSFMLLSLPLS